MSDGLDGRIQRRRANNGYAMQQYIAGEALSKFAEEGLQVDVDFDEMVVVVNQEGGAEALAAYCFGFDSSGALHLWGTGEEVPEEVQQLSPEESEDR